MHTFLLTYLESQATYSAKVPHVLKFTIANTSSLTWKSLQFGPVFTTTPETSNPGVNGNGENCIMLKRPSIIFQSATIKSK